MQGARNALAPVVVHRKMQCFGLLGLGPLDGPWKGRSLEEIPSRLAFTKEVALSGTEGSSERLHNKVTAL